MEIRLATTADAVVISSLVHTLAEKYIAHEFSAEGAGNLLGSMAPEIIERSLLCSSYRYHVAIESGELAGVIATRDNQHLFHLFVCEAFQRRGLARQLWAVARETCLAAGASGVFTVNSSRFAVGLYRKLGFIEVGPAVEQHGVVCVPMKSMPSAVVSPTE